MDLTFLTDFFGGFFGMLGDAFVNAFWWILDGFILVFGYLSYFIFDGLLTVLDGLLSTVGIATMFGNAMTQMLGLPDGMVWMLNQMGFFTGLAIIIPAIIIRKIIDCIPGGFQF